MDLNLNGKSVIVTGGAKGIGAATVRSFAAEGARVAIVDRDHEAGLALASSLDSSSTLFIDADLSEPQRCGEAAERVLREFGAIDVLVNNAGVNDGVDLDQSPDAFLASVRANLLHVYSMTHYARAHLSRSQGSIVNVSSKVAVTGQGATSGYAAAKGAIHGLTREWALAFAAAGVRVNTVVPAECVTDQYERWLATVESPKETRAAICRLIPLGRRMTRPEEIADSIVFLASSRSSHTTGQLVFVDGGYTHLDRASCQGPVKWT